MVPFLTTLHVCKINTNWHVSVYDVPFGRCVGNNILLLTKSFKKKFIIPNFSEFTQQIDRMYDIALQQEAGQVGGIHTD